MSESTPQNKALKVPVEGIANKFFDLSGESAQDGMPEKINLIYDESLGYLVKGIFQCFYKVDEILFDFILGKDIPLKKESYFNVVRELHVKRYQVYNVFNGALGENFSSFFLPNTSIDKDRLDVQDLRVFRREKSEALLARHTLIRSHEQLYSEPLYSLVCYFQSITDYPVNVYNLPLGPNQVYLSFLDSIKSIDARSQLFLLKLFEKLVFSQLFELYKNANKIFSSNNIMPTLDSRTGGKACDSVNSYYPKETRAVERAQSKEISVFSKNDIVKDIVANSNDDGVNTASSRSADSRYDIAVSRASKLNIVTENRPSDDARKCAEGISSDVTDDAKVRIFEFVFESLGNDLPKRPAEELLDWIHVVCKKIVISDTEILDQSIPILDELVTSLLAVKHGYASTKSAAFDPALFSTALSDIERFLSQEISNLIDLKQLSISIECFLSGKQAKGWVHENLSCRVQPLLKTGPQYEGSEADVAQLPDLRVCQIFSAAGPTTLQEGDAFRLKMANKVTFKCKLKAITEQCKSYIFTNDLETKVQEMSPSEVKKALDTGMLELLSTAASHNPMPKAKAMAGKLSKRSDGIRRNGAKMH